MERGQLTESSRIVDSLGVVNVSRIIFDCDVGRRFSHRILVPIGFGILVPVEDCLDITLLGLVNQACSLPVSTGRVFWLSHATGCCRYVVTGGRGLNVKIVSLFDGSKTFLDRVHFGILAGRNFGSIYLWERSEGDEIMGSANRKTGNAATRCGAYHYRACDMLQGVKEKECVRSPLFWLFRHVAGCGI